MGKREKKAAERLERILEAASEHFAIHGFDGTRMADVAKDAGVAVGTIYLRYPNKSAMLAGLLDHYETLFVNAMLDKSIVSLTWPDRFSAMFGAIMQVAANIKNMGPIMQLASHAHTQGREKGTAIRNAIKAIIEEGQMNGHFNTHIDPGIAASMSYSMVEGGMLHIMFEPNVSPEDVIEHLAEACTSWIVK